MEPCLGDSSANFIGAHSLPGKLSILIHDAGGRIRVTAILQVWNDLRDFIAEVMMGHYEEVYFQVDQVGIGFAADMGILRQELLPDSEGIATVGAEKVKEHVDLRWSADSTLLVARN